MIRKGPWPDWPSLPPGAGRRGRGAPRRLDARRRLSPSTRRASTRRSSPTLQRRSASSILLPSYRRAPGASLPRRAPGHLRRIPHGRDQGTPGDHGRRLGRRRPCARHRDRPSRRRRATPAGLLLMSPWVDLTLSGESITANDGKDAILRAKDLPRACRGATRAGIDLGDPRISPLNADLAGPAAGSHPVRGRRAVPERGHRARLAPRLRRVTRRAPGREGMWHVFQAHVGMLEEADAAVERMARVGEAATRLRRRVAPRRAPKRVVDRDVRDRGRSAPRSGVASVPAAASSSSPTIRRCSMPWKAARLRQSRARAAFRTPPRTPRA